MNNFSYDDKLIHIQKINITHYHDNIQNSY